MGPDRAHKGDVFFRTHASDCSLRQGAGGTEFARFGSRTCFRGELRVVPKRISARHLKNTLKPSKHVIRRSKKTIVE